MANQDLPNAFECLAAINKFIAMFKIDPAFHRKHYHAIEMTSAFLRTLATNDPELEAVLRKTLPSPVRESGREIAQVIPRLNWDEEQIAWFDGQLTAVLKQLLPVVADESINAWFVQFGCRWAIQGAFEAKKDGK